jgi:tight adherence protein B
MVVLARLACLLSLAIGVLLVRRSVRPSPSPRSRSRLPARHLSGQLLARSGATGVLAAFIALVVTQTLAIAVAFGLLATQVPAAVSSQRRRRQQAELRELWPEAVDNLASGVRAGLSLPEALGQLGVRGPVPLRPAFCRFADDYRATGRFSDCLDRFKAAMADPVADRIVEGLRVAREVGGADLGRLLRTLSVFLREEARDRAELETRQAWTVNAARLAVAAPWVVLGLLSVRSQAVAAYESATGLAVLLVGGLLCVTAYHLMLRIGRLPEEERVLR